MKVMPYGKDDGENPLPTWSINPCIRLDYTGPDRETRPNDPTRQGNQVKRDAPLLPSPAGGRGVGGEGSCALAALDRPSLLANALTPTPLPPAGEGSNGAFGFMQLPCLPRACDGTGHRPRV